MALYPHLCTLSSCCTVPSAVGTPSVTRVVVSGRPALRVSWTKPQSDLLITKYDVQYRQSGTTGWSTVVVSGSSTLTTTLAVVVPGRRYDVQVRAVSVAGNGAFSRIQSPVVGRGNLIVLFCFWDMHENHWPNVHI